MIVTINDEWGCGYCKRKGNQNDLKKWLKEIKSKIDQKKLSKMMNEIKSGIIQTKETLEW